MSNDPEQATSDRLGVAAAPGGLCLVQDLLNSAAMAAFDVPDLLEDETLARDWLAGALGRWSLQTRRAAPALTLGPDDLPGIRDVRRRTRTWLAGGQADLPPSTVVLRSLDDRLVHEPAEPGAQGVLGLVAAELLLAARDGVVARLKTCANPSCGAAFYDQSRNSSRVWHDVRTCGNVTNLRASRARRRSDGTGQDDVRAPRAERSPGG